MTTQTEHLPLTKGTSDILGETHYWRAYEVIRGRDGASGYGSTEAEALADLARVTAWRKAA